MRVPVQENRPAAAPPSSPPPSSIQPADATRRAPTRDGDRRRVVVLAALSHSRAVAQVLGIRFTGFFAWWFRRTYYLLQMPRWDRRLRIVLDWTVALFFRPDVTKVELG